MDSGFENLRAKALEILSTKGMVDASVWGNDVKRLVEELSIHQIELEYQNEELIRVQAEVQKASEQYVDLFDNAPVGHLIIDENHNIVNVNNTFVKLFMLTKEEVIGNEIENYIAPLFKDTFYHFYKLLQKGEVYAQVDVKMRSSMRADLYVRIDGIKQPDSKLFRLAVSNISVQKRLEEQLRKETEKVIKRESQFRQIIERSSDVFYYQNIITRRFEYVSPNVNKLLGVSHNECMDLLPMEQLEFILPPFREAYNALPDELQQAEIYNQNAIVKEFQMITKQDKVIWVKGYYSLIRDMYGQPIQIMGTLHDITSDKEYEEKLKKAKDKAEESDMLKSSFLANISHEIRTPLNSIIGFSDIILTDYDKKSEFDIKKYMDIILKSGIRLLSLINDIIFVSKLDSRQMKVVKTEFDMNQLLLDSFDIFKPEADDKHLVLRYLGDNSPMIIISDKEKITTCLHNILKNALKYTNEGFIEYAASIEAGNVLKFYVRDTGIGIPDDKKMMIFDRFSQVKQTNFMEGVGLGLSIVKGTMELLGGEVTLDSEYGKGSMFTLYIPL